MPYSGTPEEIKEKSRLYREKNKEKKKAYDSEYHKEYRDKNKDKIKQSRRKHYLENKDKLAEYQKEYNVKNKEKVSTRAKEYYQTPAGKKTKRISTWKKRGVMCDDWDALYQKYLDTHLCELCSCPLTEDTISTSTTRCLDHCHDSGLFRNVLCWGCNVRRG